MPKEVRELTLGERLVNWGKAVSFLAAAAVACYGAFFRGEPGAELAYRELAKSFNELKVEFEKERSFVAGFLDGMKQAKLSQVEVQSQPKNTVTIKPIKKVVINQTPIVCESGFHIENNKCIPKEPIVLDKLLPSKKEEPSPKNLKKDDLLPPTLQQLQRKEDTDNQEAL